MYDACAGRRRARRSWSCLSPMFRGIPSWTCWLRMHLIIREVERQTLGISRQRVSSGSGPEGRSNIPARRLKKAQKFFDREIGLVNDRYERSPLKIGSVEG